MTTPLAARWSSLPHAQARRLALPAIASHVAVPLVGLIDTAMLGHFASTQDLGGVGLGASVVAAVFWAFAFLRPGTTSLVGRALGAGDAAAVTRHLQRAFALALTLGLAWIALQWVAVPALVDVLAHGSEAGPLAADYSLIRGLSLPATLLTLVTFGYFIGAHNTRVPLAVATSLAAVNAGLDVWFVGGLGWGATGAAWATFVAEWVGAAMALAFLARGLGAEGWRSLWRWHPELRTGWGSLMSMNGALVARTGLLMAALTVVGSLGSRFGDDVLAANAILLQMMYLSSYALDGYATAAEAMAAREIGRGDVPAFHRAVAAASAAGVSIGIGLAAVWWLARDPLLTVLTDLPDVLAAAQRFWWVAALLPLLSAPSYMLDGVFLGVGRARDMLGSMGVSVGLVFVPMLVFPALAGALTNAWLWWAFLAMNVMRAVTLGWRYRDLTARRTWLARNEAVA